MTAAGLGDDPLGDLAHLQRWSTRSSGGIGRVGVAQPRDLGDVPGQVAHPLEVGAHPHAGDDDAQVGGDRLLAGQQVDRRRSSSSSLQRVDLRRRPRSRSRPACRSASSRAVVARLIAEPTSRVISTSWSEIRSSSSWKASRIGRPFVVGRPAADTYDRAAAAARAAACQRGVNEPGPPGEHRREAHAATGTVRRAAAPGSHLRWIVVDATAAPASRPSSASLVGAAAVLAIRAQRARAGPAAARRGAAPPLLPPGVADVLAAAALVAGRAGPRRRGRQGQPGGVLLSGWSASSELRSAELLEHGPRRYAGTA